MGRVEFVCFVGDVCVDRSGEFRWFEWMMDGWVGGFV